MLFGLAGGMSVVLPVHAQSVVYENPDGFEYFKRWLICGPFPIPTKLPNATYDPDSTPYERNEFQKAGFDLDYLTEHGGESGIRPQAGMAHSYEGKEYCWKFFESSRRTVNFLQAVGKVEITVEVTENKGRRRGRTTTTNITMLDEDLQVENVIAYAYAEIEMPQAGKAILSVGSDDAVKIWLNGECIHRKWSFRSLRIDDDAIETEFKQGTNYLLIKVLNGVMDWSLTCRIRQPEEMPFSYVLDKQFDFDGETAKQQSETAVPKAWDWISALVPPAILLVFLVIFFKRVARR